MSFLPVKVGSNESHKILKEYFSEVSGLSPATLEAKGRDLRLFLTYFERANNHLELSTWLPLDTARFRLELIKKPFAPASINRILASVRHFGRFGWEKGYWSVDPTKGVRDLELPALQPKFLEESNLHKLRKAAELLCLRNQRGYDQSLRNRVMLETLYASGIRVSELINLRLANLEGKKLRGVLCKGSKSRDILIPQYAADLIHEYIATTRVPGSDFIFTNREGNGLDRRSVGRALDRLAEVASTKSHAVHVSPHMLRHTHAKRIRQIRDPVSTARRLGHSSLAYVERYSSSTLADDEKLMDDFAY